MQQDVKAKWVEALRSGKYSQTTGMLCNGESYCCLGVLCELYIAENASGEFTKKSLDSRLEFVEDVRNTPYVADFMQIAEEVTESNFLLKEDGELPWTVAKWAGLNSFDTDPLINMNDMGRVSFADIATYIEEKL